MNYRRVNLFGGAGCGKSTMAADIFVDLKKRGYKVGLVKEFVKGWAYKGTVPVSLDEVYLFGCQVHEEDVPLQGGEDLIISDSPLLIHACYAEILGCPLYPYIYDMCKEIETIYPSINIFLDREGIEYQQEGRYSDLENAKSVDEKIKYELRNYEFETFKTLDYNLIINYIMRKLE